MINALKKTTAVLLFAAAAVVSVTSCSHSEELEQEEAPDVSQTVSDTMTEEAETEETTTSVTTTATTTTTNTTTTSATATTTSATTTTAPPITTTTVKTTTTAPPPVTTTTTTAPPPVTTTTAAPPPVTTTTTAAAAPAPTESMADQVFRLVNEIRAEYGLPAFKKLDPLTGAAQKRAAEISGYYSHTRPNGTNSYTVIKEYGLNYRTTGENIAAGQRTAQQVVNDWMGSTMGHREAILSSDYQYMGVGYVTLSSNDVQGLKYYWTQEFFTPL